MLGRTSNQPGWLERCNVLVLSCLDSLFASKPVGPGFEPCQSAKLAGAPKPLCLNQIDEICRVSVKREGAGPPTDQPGRVTVWPRWLVDGDPPPAVGHPGRQGRPLQGPAAALSRAVRRGLGVTSPTTWQGRDSTIKSGIASTDERGGLPRNRSGSAWQGHGLASLAC